MEQPRIGVYICWCGSNIAKMVDVEAVAKEMAGVPNVVVARDYKYMCSDPGQDLIVKDIKEHKLNRIVVAACSPRIHEPTFRKALKTAGLNPYFFEMANIREQDSWVHVDRAAATQKARDLIKAAIRRVAYHEALESRTVSINPASLVLGGGVAGLTAAFEIASTGKKVFLVEKTDRLGGFAVDFEFSFPTLSPAQTTVQALVKNVSQHQHIKVFLNTAVKEISGYVGNFKTKIKDQELEFGNIIVATGLKSFNPDKITEYGFGKLPNVITSVEFEKRARAGKLLMANGQTPKHVAIIHCVGSRNEKYHEYCSRTCCATALKFANQVKNTLPQTNVYQLYADMRAFGKGCEELYTQTAKKGVVFMMFDQLESMPKVRRAAPSDGCDMIIELDEKLSGQTVDVSADLVVLMTAVEAHDDARDIAHAAGVSLCGNAFYIERHPKLDPVGTTTDGVYIVGSCQGPKDISDSVIQAKAAVARVLATICQGKVPIEVTTAVVDEDLCCGCQTCVKVCPYSAVKYNEEKKASEVNEALCKGCGTCGAACPSGAIRCRHFTDQQILSQIEGVFAGNE